MNVDSSRAQVTQVDGPIAVRRVTMVAVVTKEEGAFLTHANYLRAIASEAGLTLVSTEKKALASVAARVSKSPSSRDSASGPIDHDQVKRSLANAWGTELLLALSGRHAVDDEIVRLANNWAVVQAYYVVYHATQALAVAKGFPPPDSHRKTQNQYASFWIKRPLNLSPWTFGADDGGWVNCPPSRSIDSSIHGWTGCSPATQLSLAAKAFRTTRDDSVSEALDRLRDRVRVQHRREWEAEESARRSVGKKARVTPTWRRPQLSAAERAAAAAKVPPHGLIDYLYRLRIKTNYVDSAMFTDGPPDKTSSATVQRDLRYIAGSTLVVHELHIARLVGVTRLQKWADDWLAANAPVAGARPLALQLRRPLL
jgi:hypothetical protein